jgi:hypothetical protein
LLAGLLLILVGTVVIDVLSLQRDADKIKLYCRTHRDETIMKAIEAEASPNAATHSPLISLRGEADA